MRFNQPIITTLAFVPFLAGAAQAVTITSGVTPGITAYAATTRTTYYGNYVNGCTEFAPFSAADFAAADAAPLASTLTSSIPGAWNNSGNTASGWDGTGGSTAAAYGAMNAAGARWIHNSTDALNGGTNSPTLTTDASGVSVLYSIPFASTASLVNITLRFVTDNGLGNTYGANGKLGHTGFQNNGLFVNSPAGDLDYSSTPNTGGEPTQFDTINTLTFNNVAVNIGDNRLYFYEFNWGSYGGSAFTFDVQMVPLPPAAWAGLSTLAGVAGFGLIRRRKMHAC